MAPRMTEHSDSSVEETDAADCDVEERIPAAAAHYTELHRTDAEEAAESGGHNQP